MVIAGAGPAGCAVAARLGQHGLAGDVVVVDRYQFPRDKPCGGALTGHADQVMAELELELSVDHYSCHDARVRYGSFERVVAMGKPVQVISRQRFDHSLVEQIRQRGVEVREGDSVEGYDVRDDRVEVELSSGKRIEADVLVGADGAASVVRKALYAGQKDIPHRLFRTELVVPGAPADQTIMTYDFSPMAHGLRGYLWLFPMPGNMLNVGLMHYPSTRLGGRDLTETLRKGLVDHGIELPAKGTRGWPVWGYQPKGLVSGPRVLTVGDAAGIDGLTGEGISVAMEQAVVAGDRIAEGLAGGDLSMSDYRQRLRRAVVGRELALDRWLARLLYGGDGWRRWLSLVLFDADVLDMYARRVDGTQILADQKARLWRALARHAVRARARRRMLASAQPAS